MDPERQRCKVLVFGASTLVYSETTPEESSIKLIERRLRELDPETDWQCVPSVLYYSPGMPRRVHQVIERERPDMVYFRPPGMQLVNDYVINRIRERWPRLYNSSTRVAELFNRLAGGGPDGAPGARGWLFRGPRWLLAKTIGAAPAMRVPEAVAVVRETLDDVLRIEDLTVVYSVPSNVVPPNIPAEEAASRLREFAAAVAEYCVQRRVRFVEPAVEYAKRGVVRRLGSDRWHPDAESRRRDADIVGEILIEERRRAAAYGPHQRDEASL